MALQQRSVIALDQETGERVVVSDTQASPQLALEPETMLGNRGVQQR
jgi:hypothetical protein